MSGPKGEGEGWIITGSTELREKLAAYSQDINGQIEFDTNALAGDLIIIFKISGVTRAEFVLGMAGLWDEIEIQSFAKGSARN